MLALNGCLDRLDPVESFTIHVFLTNRLRLSFTPKVELTFYQAKRSGHFEFKTLLLSSSAFFKKPKYFSVPGHPTGHMCRIGILESRTKIFDLCKFSSATMQATWFLQVPPRYSFKNIVLVRHSGSMPK